MRKNDVLIRIAETKDMEATTKILTSGFLKDPALYWLVDDYEERVKVFERLFQVYMNLGLEKGVVHIAETAKQGIVGVSIWCPPDAEDIEFDKAVERIAGEHTPKFSLYSEIMHSYYPPAGTYEKLSLIATVPEIRGHGIGSALVAYRLKELDAMGMPSYLEASTRLSAGGVYERLGYRPIGEPIRFPSGEEIYPMWRPVHELVLDTNIDKAFDSHVTDSIVRFGPYNWRILDMQDDKMLIISDNVVISEKYHEKYENITWVGCTLRQFLKNTFYNTFSEVEKLRIIETRLQSYNNPWFGTDAGKYTKDTIFILSIEEVVKYFGNSGQLIDKNKNTKYYINDNFNKVRKAVNLEKSPSRWLLRSPGGDQTFVACITADGRIAVSGDFVNRSSGFAVGVRPAMWISKA